jgi:hypothetical protein
MFDAYRIQAQAGPDRQGALLNTSLEGATLATYHVVAIIETRMNTRKRTRSSRPAGCRTHVADRELTVLKP